MGNHNKEKNYSFYMDARTMDIIKEWTEHMERGAVSGLIREAIRRLYLYPHNPNAMLEVGYGKLDKEEREYFDLLLEAMIESKRDEMRRIMSAPEPAGPPMIENDDGD